MKTKTTLIAGLLAISALALYTNTRLFAQDEQGPQPKEGHPIMVKALHELEQAQKDLQAAQHDFGGHRVSALKACNQAIAECKLALNYDKK
jgi:hypothetical protein